MRFVNIGETLRNRKQFFSVNVSICFNNIAFWNIMQRKRIFSSFEWHIIHLITCKNDKVIEHLTARCMCSLRIHERVRLAYAYDKYDVYCLCCGLAVNEELTKMCGKTYIKKITMLISSIGDLTQLPIPYTIPSNSLWMKMNKTYSMYRPLPNWVNILSESCVLGVRASRGGRQRVNIFNSR